MTGPATCSAPECQAEIIFARTVAGVETPFDREPHPEGTWLLSRRPSTGEVHATYAGRPGSSKAERQEAEAAGRNFFRSHFATCPAAKTFRRADHVPDEGGRSSEEPRSSQGSSSRSASPAPPPAQEATSL